MIKKITGEIPLDNVEKLNFDAFLELDCPNCKRTMVVDFNKEHLVSPKVNEDDSVWIDCSHCSSSYVLPIVLKSVKAVVHYDIRDMVEQSAD